MVPRSNTRSQGLRQVAEPPVPPVPAHETDRNREWVREGEDDGGGPDGASEVVEVAALPAPLVRHGGVVARSGDADKNAVRVVVTLCAGTRFRSHDLRLLTFLAQCYAVVPDTSSPRAASMTCR